MNDNYIRRYNGGMKIPPLHKNETNLKFLGHTRPIMDQTGIIALYSNLI